MPVKSETKNKNVSHKLLVQLHSPNNSRVNESEKCCCEKRSSEREVPNLRRSPRFLKRKQTSERDSFDMKTKSCKRLKSSAKAETENSESWKVKLREELEC